MRTGTRYADDFKEAAVELYTRSRRTQGEIAADIGVTTRTLRRWLRDRERLGPQWINKKGDLQRQLATVRKENALLRRELGLLGDMNRFFARETR